MRRQRAEHGASVLDRAVRIGDGALLSGVYTNLDDNIVLVEDTVRLSVCIFQPHGTNINIGRQNSLDLRIFDVVLDILGRILDNR